MRRVGIVAGLLLALACASAPPAPAPGTAQVTGSLRLVPPAGVGHVGHGGGSYGDRRMRDVTFVDYTRPGFAVVYLDDEPPPAGTLAFSIASSRVGTRMEPRFGAIGAGGTLSIRNDTELPHVLSAPAAGLVVSVLPGEQIELAVPRAGEQGLFVLDVSNAAATVFAAPGPFSVVDAVGRFTLSDLTPGVRELRVWHPRFPPASRSVELAPDARVPVEIELGTGRETHTHAH